MEGSKLKLKLLVDTKANKVLFAEADEASMGFVDFVFHILVLPVGTAVKLLTMKGKTEGLKDLYKSIEALWIDYFEAEERKESVQLIPACKKFYVCCDESYDDYLSFITNNPTASCPKCGAKMLVKYKFLAPEGTVDPTASKDKSDGYAKEVMMYLVMDNLRVIPMRTVSASTLIKHFYVEDINDLVEMEVQLGVNEGLAMSKASFETGTLLTTAFLGNGIKI